MKRLICLLMGHLVLPPINTGWSKDKCRTCGKTVNVFKKDK